MARDVTMLLWSDRNVRLVAANNVLSPDQLGTLHECSDLLEKTRVQCNEMRLQAQHECERQVEAAVQRGEQLAHAELTRLTLDFHHDVAQTAQRLRQKVAWAAVACVEKMLHDAGPRAALVQRAIRLVQQFWQDAPLVFMVSPATAPMLRNALEDFRTRQRAAQDGSLNRVRLIVKESLELDDGDVILQTSDGLIDGRLRTQLSYLEKIFEMDANFHDAGVSDEPTCGDDDQATGDFSDD
jgi:flagellar biosynthesis/type III secretory pathway protein FliH